MSAPAGEDVDPLTILHVTAPAPAGGLERVVHALARGHQARGHRVHVAAVVVPRDQDSPFFGPLVEANVPHSQIVLPARAYFRERRRIRRLCREFRPHVVHTHGARSDLLHGSVVRKLGVASVTTLHGSSWLGGKGDRERWVEKLQRKLVGRFDGVIAVSEPLAEELAAAGVPRDRLFMIPNAWSAPGTLVPREEARQRLEIESDRPVVGFIGRLVPVKGADLLLRAVAQMDRVQAVLVGDGSERGELQSLARLHGISDRVTFTGMVPSAGCLMAAFDVFALPSRSEGTPIALLEAMAAGVPVVATRVGGVPGVLGEGAGWLVPPEDPEALAGALTAALDDRDAAEARVRTARGILAGRLAEGPWLSRHEALYRRVAKR